jgi:hypothetical protein
LYQNVTAESIDFFHFDRSVARGKNCSAKKNAARFRCIVSGEDKCAPAADHRLPKGLADKQGTPLQSSMRAI